MHQQKLDDNKMLTEILTVKQLQKFNRKSDMLAYTCVIQVLISHFTVTSHCKCYFSL